jgi:hypothetical protein
VSLAALAFEMATTIFTKGCPRFDKDANFKGELCMMDSIYMATIFTMKHYLLVSLALSASLIVHGGGAHAADIAAQCRADLEDARAFITANDAGASALLADHGPAITHAYDTALAASASDAGSCLGLLTAYLRAWRPGHLAILRAPQDSIVPPSAAHPASQAKADMRAPRLQALDKNTLLLTLPTFSEAYRSILQAFLSGQRGVLQSHRNWIIDVRDNDGGSDATFQPLLAWLLDGELRTHATEFFVTPANIQAQEDVCAFVSDKAACKQMVAPIVAAMRTVQPGSFVSAGGQSMLVQAVPPEPMRPSRVAVLIDTPCGSSCEQFVLEARTGARVKVLGRPTQGVLDVSNLRPHRLPSGRILFYATTRSTRLPAMRIDGIGIAPDILLPTPKDQAARDAEVAQVQRWLEGGSLGTQ